MKIMTINVDTQNDFMLPDGKLSIPNAMSIAPNLARLTEWSGKQALSQINTADWHRFGDGEVVEQPDFVNTWPYHCMEFTHGAMYIPETKIDDVQTTVVYHSGGNDFPPQFPRVVFLKNRVSLFEGNVLAERMVEWLLRRLEIDTVIVWGVAANICVDLAIRDMLSLKNKYWDFQLIAVEDAVKAINCTEKECFDKWQDQGIEILTTKQVLTLESVRSTTTSTRGGDCP